MNVGRVHSAVVKLCVSGDKTSLCARGAWEHEDGPNTKSKRAREPHWFGEAAVPIAGKG